MDPEQENSNGGAGRLHGRTRKEGGHASKCLQEGKPQEEALLLEKVLMEISMLKIQNQRLATHQEESLRWHMQVRFEGDVKSSILICVFTIQPSCMTPFAASLCCVVCEQHHQDLKRLMELLQELLPQKQMGEGRLYELPLNPPTTQKIR